MVTGRRASLLSTSRPLVAVLATVSALVLPGDAHALTVYGAASLRDAFPDVAAAPTYSFGGSDQLALQIRNGAPADVFASAGPRFSRDLFRDGLCTRPRVFATNRLVLVVPKANRARIRSVFDLARGEPKRLAIGSPNVPIGAYTRTLLARLRLSSVLTRNTVSNESNVTNVVGKVALGSADAGFVYATDHRTAADRLSVIPLPAHAQPPVPYEVCAVMRPGADTGAAARFIRRVLSPTGRRALRATGFGLPVLP